MGRPLCSAPRNLGVSVVLRVVLVRVVVPRERDLRQRCSSRPRRVHVMSTRLVPFTSARPVTVDASDDGTTQVMPAAVTEVADEAETVPSTEIESGFGAAVGLQPPLEIRTASPPVVPPPIFPSVNPPAVLKVAERFPRRPATNPLASAACEPGELSFRVHRAEACRHRVPSRCGCLPDTVPMSVVVLIRALGVDRDRAVEARLRADGAAAGVRRPCRGVGAVSARARARSHDARGRCCERRAHGLERARVEVIRHSYSYPCEGGDRGGNPDEFPHRHLRPLSIVWPSRSESRPRLLRVLRTNR